MYRMRAVHDCSYIFFSFLNTFIHCFYSKKHHDAVFRSSNAQSKAAVFQTAFHKKTKVRDLALMTLLLGTGIRVSECIGLDLKDVDFKNNGILIRRKGGYEAVVYFGDEVEAALKKYLEQ